MALLGAALWRLVVVVDSAEPARERLEKQRRGVEQMVMAALTHDVRSPLQEATTYTSQLLKRSDATSIKQTALRLQQSHGCIDRMLRSLLDSLALDAAHRLPLQRSRCELHALVQEVIKENEARLGDRIVTSRALCHGRAFRDDL